MMITVSDEMFDRVVARAREVAEEQFRRLVFDTKMRPEAAQLVHDQVVDRMAERHIDDLADHAVEWIKRDSRADP
jgi:hypothetical protein